VDGYGNLTPAPVNVVCNGITRMEISISLLPPLDAGDISGQVTDAATGLPIEGATVLLAQGNTLIASTTTNAQGVYAFQDVAFGYYVVAADATGYSRSIADNVALVTVVDVQTTRVNFALEPEVVPTPTPVSCDVATRQ
jgi:hypothetical protein